ncbi:cysteine hydrolase family protein [Limosilactobacillus pontis]|uniref:cysteine hydrolase family protein n=1 Tax=Limosilactobacillus pontis TaxID=35787 RepID=UPI0022484B80|nr:cysteine hydrolase family protein [Limosilactobacillus pontis]MCX2187432.1 cysteine hydrolase [Limosilactobacillus pontis]MCX2189194.1 cysteine hydrolase [Limosilactobacillus pontis]
MTKALIIIDMQNGVVNPAGKVIYNQTGLVHLINERIAAYRQAQLPIIFVQHVDEDLVPDSSAWQLVPSLSVLPTDLRIQKEHPNAFYRTNLQAILTQRRVDQLEICGAQTEYCVDATIKMAHGLGYQVVMKHGAASTFDNSFMTAQEKNAFFARIWQDRFLKLID